MGWGPWNRKRYALTYVSVYSGVTITRVFNTEAERDQFKRLMINCGWINKQEPKTFTTEK